jgi:hypothetical protein
MNSIGIFLIGLKCTTSTLHIGLNRYRSVGLKLYWEFHLVLSKSKIVTTVNLYRSFQGYGILYSCRWILPWKSHYFYVTSILPCLLLYSCKWKYRTSLHCSLTTLIALKFGAPYWGNDYLAHWWESKQRFAVLSCSLPTGTQRSITGVEENRSGIPGNSDNIAETFNGSCCEVEAEVHFVSSNETQFELFR